MIYEFEHRRREHTCRAVTGTSTGVLASGTELVVVTSIGSSTIVSTVALASTAARAEVPVGAALRRRTVAGAVAIVLVDRADVAVIADPKNDRAFSMILVFYAFRETYWDPEL